ncbi:MAG: hypothetical protein KF760_05080 [Candidatus Eremiobacteraeota bacterium]|nr:hypothetical protein [Candidatus Eremiobacteraeota bacterium]
MTGWLDFLPFSYFWNSRLKSGSILFHLTFEWLSATILAFFYGRFGASGNLLLALLCYLAFISIYEIGYLCNDCFASRFESNPRRRGSERLSDLKVWGMLSTRLLFFLLVSYAFGASLSRQWFPFYLALTLTFALHNLPLAVHYKLITFTWLSVFRFTAPTIFLLQPVYLAPLFQATLLFYTGYRLLPYMDSKGLLHFPGRRQPAFRLAYYWSILPLAYFLRSSPGGHLVLLLAQYFAMLALLGFLTGQGKQKHA